MAEQIISSVHGRIKQIFMVYDRDSNYQLLLEELINKLSDHTQIILLINSYYHSSLLITLRTKFPQHKFATDFSNTSKDAKGIILEKQMLPHKEISMWARDHFLVFQHNQNSLPRWFKPIDQTNVDSPENLSYYNITGNPMTVPNWFCIDGGNILVGKSHILIGGNEFLSVFKKLFRTSGTINRRSVIASIQSSLNTQKKIIIIGAKPHDCYDILPFDKEENEYSPLLGIFIPELWFEEQQKPDKDNDGLVVDPDSVQVHIDMFITMTGESYNNKPILFIGQPIALDLEFCDIANRIECHITDIIKTQLNKEFIIMRNPMPILKSTNGDRYMCLYNNCIVENTNKKKTVWLPSFAWQQYTQQLTPYDKANKMLWEITGFEVKLIKTNFHHFSVSRGALHCLTNELVRK